MQTNYDRQPPENRACVAALEMARHNPTLLRVIQEDIENIGKKFKCEEEMEPVLTALSDTLSMAEYAESIRGPLYSKIWDGTITPEEMEMLKPGYFTYQDLLANRILQDIDKSVIEEKMQNVSILYDINDNSEFIRAYMSNGKQLDANNADDKKIIDLYDQCFHSWLVKNNMSSQDGVIYNTTKLDKQGNYIEKADKTKIISLINNPNLGLDTVVKKQGKNLKLQVERFEQPPEALIAAQVD